MILVPVREWLANRYEVLGMNCSSSKFGNPARIYPLPYVIWHIGTPSLFTYQVLLQGDDSDAYPTTIFGVSGS